MRAIVLGSNSAAKAPWNPRSTMTPSMVPTSPMANDETVKPQIPHEEHASSTESVSECF